MNKGAVSIIMVMFDEMFPLLLCYVLVTVQQVDGVESITSL